MENKMQWSRRELKERSKAVLRTHYWRIVLVALLLSLLADGDKTPLGVIESVVQEQTGSVEEKEPVLYSLGLSDTYRIIRDHVLNKQYMGGIVVGTAVFTAFNIF